MNLDLERDIRAAVDVMSRGGVILYPTDTIWGLGCDSSNQAAVERIFKIKNRADSKSMISLADSLEMVVRHTGEIPERVREMIMTCRNPLTVIYDKAFDLSPSLISSDGSVALRITDETYSKALCTWLGRPVVSTSANISGYPAPSIFAEIDEDIKNAVDYIAYYRREDTDKHRASSIIKLTAQGDLKIIRQ